MELDTTIMTPAQATAIVRGTFDSVSANMPMNAYLPNTLNDSLFVKWTPNVREELDEVQFSAPDVEAPYGKTVGAAVGRTAELMFLRQRMRISEADIINNAANSTEWKRNKLTEYLTRLATNAALRLERARVETLVNASFTLAENGIHGVNDYERDSALTVKLTSTKTWDSTNVDPIKDLETWKQKIDDLNGEAPATMVVTKNVMNMLRYNKAMIAEFCRGASGTLPARIGVDEVKQVIANNVQIRNVVVVDELYGDYMKQINSTFKGGLKTLFPDNTVLLLPSTAVGVTSIGPTAEISEARYGVSGSGPVGAIFGVNGTLPGGEAYFNASALPVLVMSNSTATATVK